MTDLTSSIQARKGLSVRINENYIVDKLKLEDPVEIYKTLYEDIYVSLYEKEPHKMGPLGTINHELKIRYNYFWILRRCVELGNVRLFKFMYEFCVSPELNVHLLSWLQRYACPKLHTTLESFISNGNWNEPENHSKMREIMFSMYDDEENAYKSVEPTIVKDEIEPTQILFKPFGPTGPS
jgi:hypothetical protein